MNGLESTMSDMEICRLCLSLTIVKINIFTEDFAKMVEILTSLKISPEDSLPKISCLKCARDVKSAFLVRRRIIQSYRAFNSKLNRLRANHIRLNPTSLVRKPIIANVQSRPGAERPTERLKSILDEEKSSNNVEVSEENSESNTENAGFSEDCETRSLDGKSDIIDVKNESSLNYSCETNEKTSVGKIEHPLEVRFENTLSSKQSEKIQDLKLDINTRYIDWLASLNASRNMNTLKHMKTTDQVNILRWMEKKQNSEKNLSTRLASATQRKKEPVKLYCNNCQIKFNNKITFKNHMTKHKHKICPVCDKQIRSAYLKRHMTLHEDAPVVCEICGQTCKNPCSLRMHFFYYHKNPNFCVCEDCGRLFRTKTKLLYHQRKDHTKERNFKCEICGKSFFLKMYLTKHISMKHMKQRPYICEYCGKGFSGKHALRTHVRQHTNEAPYQCNFCGERFKQRVSLRGHLKSRHKIEEENKEFCDTCGKGFVSILALDVHSRLHMEIKCSLCSDTFAEKEYLDQHIATVHANESDDQFVDNGKFEWI